MSKRSAARIGKRRFLLNSTGAVEAMQEKRVIVYQTKNGKVVLRKASRRTSIEQKIKAIQNLLEGLKNNHWISEGAKKRVELALKKKMKDILEEVERRKKEQEMKMGMLATSAQEAEEKIRELDQEINKLKEELKSVLKEGEQK